jgi:OTU-like cysteine protease
MSCLFNSMSHFIKDNGGPHAIRQRICDYLQNNLPILDGMETRDILQLEAPSSEHYISNMRKSSTWGGAIEIQCACNIWKACIVVRDIRNCNRNNGNNNNNNKIEFLPLHANANANIHPILTQLDFELEWSGGHYEPYRN